MSHQAKPAQPATVECNHAWNERLPFHDRADFDNAARGFIAHFDADVIRRDADGRVVWDFRAYDFQDSDKAPDTVHPSLWRLARLNNHAGLFKVCERIYQIRGFDLSNMNVIEGDTGLIIMDPLVSSEVAAAALELYYRHRPRRPVVAVIYTHSHVDHFGGVKGVVSEEDVRAGRVRVYAPDGFMEETVSENVFAGPAMNRRAQYMYGGLLPRGPRVWSYYLGETLAHYGDRSDVLFAQHHWPTWGGDNIREFLADQRDMYAFLNDETLRLLNHGLTPLDIADRLKSLPQPLANRWYARDYYGSVSHNVRAVYQRYMGFYDANPAHLNPLPPVASARRTIDWMGGADRVLEKAAAAFRDGEYRWVAEIVNQVVFADPANDQARALQADALEQLGYQCENTTWRNAYLTGAQELRGGVKRVRGGQPPDLVRALTPSLFFSFLAVRLNSEAAASSPMTLNWHFPDLQQDYALTVRNGVLTHLADHRHAGPDAEVRMQKADLDRVGLGEISLEQALKDGLIQVSGDGGRVSELFLMLDRFEPGFNIVTPVV